jgi:uncharacterized protein (TIGR02453 family)
METIKTSTLQFLSDLKKNNDKEWFNRNRAEYEDARKNFGSFVQNIIEGITEFDPIMKGLEAKNCIFRIFRDTRFSNDKSIYKTNMGAFIVRGGKKNGDRFAGYYIHIEPGECMIAGGAYMPPAPWLAAIREKISEQGEVLGEIISDREFKTYFKGLDGEKLKTSPKGYPKDHPYIELLRYKSYTVARHVTDRQISAPDSYDMIIKTCRAMKPLNDFLSEY